MSQTRPSLLLLLLAIHGALALKLCSFNVRSFGESKKQNQNAMDVIVKVSPVPVGEMLGSPTALSPDSILWKTQEEFN